MRSIAYRRDMFARLLILALLASGLAGYAPRTAHAADGWSSAQRITSDEIGINPDMVIDSQNVTHIVYTQTPDFNSTRIVRYINNRGGSWSDPVTLSAPGLFADLGRLSTVTINGQVNLALVFKAQTGKTDTSRIYYRLSTDGGASWGAQEQMNNFTSFEPAVLLDDTGQPHVTFTYKPGATYTMAYITRINGAWTSPVILSTPTNSFNRDTSIGYTRANGTLTLHVLFMGSPNGTDLTKHIYYTRKIGAGGWEAPRQRQSDSGGGYPKLVTDQLSNVYGVWHVNSADYGYEPYFSRTLDNGSNWDTPQVVGSKTSDIGERPAIARTISGIIAVLWADQYRTTGGTQRDIFARISEDDGAHWSGAKDISPAAGVSTYVTAAASDAGFQAAWHDDRKNGNYQIYISSYALAGGVVGPSATPLLDGGLPTTRNNVVAVSFTNVTGSPDSVRYHWDAPPTDADAWVPFASPLVVPGPAGVTAAACQTHTLYTQVRKGATAGPLAQDSEAFDIGVQADVNMLNPHLASLAASGAGATDGDPSYTRDPAFYLDISGFTDCSGLSSFSLAGGASTPITNNNYANTLALPGGSALGPHTISIDMTDALGNAQTYSSTLIYDPANTDTTGTQPNTSGLPVLRSGGSATADSANSIIRTFAFQGINVTDNLYGQQPNLPQLPAGQQFWGVWIANSTAPTATADDPSLRWYPVRVAAPGSSFTVRWDLFAGLNIPYAELRNRPGTYYLFVRFLDGAGNASASSIKATATLTTGYDIPTLRLPIQAH